MSGGLNLGRSRFIPHRHTLAGLNAAPFTAVEQLQEHIDAFIKAYNEAAEPFA